MWAFLVLTETEQSLLWKDAPHALGRILATIEASLTQWESGKDPTQKDGSASTGQSESTRFASFLGRSRFHFPFHHVGDPLDETDEEQSTQQLKKPGLPLLREIPVDPLTLCKLSASLGTLRLRYHGFKTEGSITKVPQQVSRALVYCFIICIYFNVLISALFYL